MAEILLKGAPVAAALDEATAAAAEALKGKGSTPTLATLRVGGREDDLSYERAARKRCEKVGAAMKTLELPADVDNDTLLRALDGLNRDEMIHGILLFRPLPRRLDEEAARRLLAPEKDVDGCTDASLGGVFTGGSRRGFPPCTAQAVMEILRYYQIDPMGKRVAVVGRSLVVGRPAAMLLMEAGATVTVCHSQTADVPAVTREAEIVVAACGKPELLGAEYFTPGAGQIVIDVGVNWNEQKQTLCGDVDFAAVEPLVGAITPVPGGVGGVTTSVLVSHAVQAAKQ